MDLNTGKNTGKSTKGKIYGKPGARSLDFLTFRIGEHAARPQLSHGPGKNSLDPFRILPTDNPDEAQRLLNHCKLHLHHNRVHDLHPALTIRF